MRFLIISTLALVLAHGSMGVIHYGGRQPVQYQYNRRPCQRNNDNNAYNRFVHKHFLHEEFDRNSRDEWKAYLQRYQLCDRPQQSFLKKRYKRRVNWICNGSGRPVRRGSDLCIGASSMEVYDITVGNNCEILSRVRRRTYVVVACNRVENRCRPVHFERYTGQTPYDRNKRCEL